MTNKNAVEPGNEKVLDLNAEWEAVREKLRTEVGDPTFNSWLNAVALADFQGNVITLSAPSKVVRDRVERDYGARIRELWRREHPTVEKIHFSVRSHTRRQAGTAKIEPNSKSEFNGKVQGKVEFRAADAPSASVNHRKPEPATDDALASLKELSARLDARLSFDNFVVAKSNELAHAAARKIADESSVVYNPLYIYGGVGLGKTHLMHAIALHIRQKHPSRRVIYLSAEKFMYQFINALRFKDTMAFKQQFRSVDVLLIDDVQFIVGKDSTQEEFFHTFNALVDNNRQIVISGDRSPADLGGMEERLRTRLGWGLVADIHPSDYELRLGILQAREERANTHFIPMKVLEFLAHRITSNLRELEGAYIRLKAHADLIGREISMDMAQDALRDLLRANNRRLTIEDIQKKVSEHFSVRLSEMHSSRRARIVARPRQIAMYLAKQLTPRSLPEIGRRFGNRDHTTVMYAVRKVEELRESDASFAEDLDLLRRMLED